MEKPTRRESCILMTVTALVIFAWLCRLLDIPWHGGSNPIRAVIYPILFSFWGFTLHHRLTHPQVRHFAVSIAVLMVVWFMLRTIKYSLSDQFPDMIRYLWYLYYLPMVFTPTLAVLTAQAIDLPDSERLPRKWNILWIIAAAIFLMVITNDLHQLVFAFPDNGAVWTDKDYSYSIGYYAYAVYVVVCNLCTFVILVMKRRGRGRRGWMMIPGIPLFLLLLYWAFYITAGGRGWLKYSFGDLTAFTCVMYMTSFELCIRCGLIRSNTGYGELFRVSHLGAQIVDHSHVVRLSGANAAALTGEQILSAESQPLLLEHNLLLKSKPIRFGTVLWQEDVSELTEAIEQIEENCQDLDEQSRIDRENLEAEKTILSLQEKNRTIDLLHRETAGQLDLIDSLLERYHSENDEMIRRRLLTGTAVVGAYIKRYGNLLMVCERNKEAAMEDLTRCFEESFISLELLGAECLCSLPAGLTMKTEDMLRIYRTFERALEACMYELRHVWVNGREQDGHIVVNIEFVSDVDLSKLAFPADGFTNDSGTSRFTFKAEKGGVKEWVS